QEVSVLISRVKVPQLGRYLILGAPRLGAYRRSDLGAHRCRIRPARGCRARRSVAPRRRAQAARSQAGSRGAAQSCVGEAARPGRPAAGLLRDDEGSGWPSFLLPARRTVTVTVPSRRCRSSGGKYLRASSGTVERSLFSLLVTL